MGIVGPRGKSDRCDPKEPLLPADVHNRTTLKTRNIHDRDNRMVGEISTLAILEEGERENNRD